MKIHNGLLIAATVACSICVAPAFAKTAKECTAEWRADKAGMQARGVAEKAYVEQRKGQLRANRCRTSGQTGRDDAATSAQADDRHRIKNRERVYGRVARR